MSEPCGLMSSAGILSPWRKFWTIVKKEFLHIIRDARTLGLILLFPGMLLILLGYGVSGESKNLAFAVADLSKTDESRQYVSYYTSSEDFELLFTLSQEDCNNLLKKWDGPVTIKKIGQVIEPPNIKIKMPDGKIKDFEIKGYDHFA